MFGWYDPEVDQQTCRRAIDHPNVFETDMWLLQANHITLTLCLELQQWMAKQLNLTLSSTVEWYIKIST